jgi:hypothetical protein
VGKVYFIGFKESRIPWSCFGGVGILEAVTKGQARHEA